VSPIVGAVILTAPERISGACDPAPAPVCTENMFHIDHVTEPPNVGGDDRWQNLMPASRPFLAVLHCFTEVIPDRGGTTRAGTRPPGASEGTLNPT
jgi:hypothetical protein